MLFHQNIRFFFWCMSFSSAETNQSGLSSSTSVRPRLPFSGHYLGQLVVMCSTVCSRSEHSLWALSLRPHFCIAAPRHPTPVLRQLRVLHCFQGRCWPEKVHGVFSLVVKMWCFCWLPLVPLSCSFTGGCGDVSHCWAPRMWGDLV